MLLSYVKKAGKKLHALARVSNYMSFNQKILIFNAFISSQFNYCPLIWLCHSRSLNTRINKIHNVLSELYLMTMFRLLRNLLIDPDL